MSVFETLQHALILMLQLSMPVILVAAGIGVAVGLLQALTQIQDQTLPHAVKLVGVGAVILLLGGALSARLVGFTVQVFSAIASGGR